MNQKGAETMIMEAAEIIVDLLIMKIHRARRTATIVTLDVCENERRNGYGTQLLERSEEMLADYGVEAYDLQVDVTNIGAISFYKKHGFSTVRTLRRYYANGNDAFLMVKEL